jgi:hypothetical protein
MRPSKSGRPKKKATPSNRTPEQEQWAEFRRFWKKFQREIAGMPFKNVRQVELLAPTMTGPDGKERFTGERTATVRYVK